MTKFNETSAFDAMIDDSSIDYQQVDFDLMMDDSCDAEACVLAADEYVQMVDEQKFDQLLMDVDFSFDEFCPQDELITETDFVMEEVQSLDTAVNSSSITTISGDHGLSSTQISLDSRDQAQQVSQVGYGNPSDIEIDFQILEEGAWRFNKNYHTKTKLLRAKLGHEDGKQLDITKVSDAIDEAYARFVHDLIRDAEDNDRIFITFRNTEQSRELYISFYKRNFHKEEFLARAYKLAQSSGAFLDGSVFEIKIQIIKSISGKGRTVSHLLPASVRSHLKKSVIEIINDDHKCGYLAIALGKYHCDFFRTRLIDRNKWQRVSTSPIQQTKIASEMFMEFNLDCSAPMDIQKLSEIQEKLVQYQIIAIDRRTKLKIFGGPERKNKLLLEYSEPAHWNTITSMTAYMDCEGFCARCWLKTNASRNHICKDGCKKCSSIQVCSIVDSKTCEVCFVTFSSSECFTNHIENGVCKRRSKCEKCWVVSPMNDEHKCGQYTCHICNCKYTNSPHYCFIKPLNAAVLKDEDESQRFIICYDIEAMQIPLNENEFTHVPNLLISQTLCMQCIDPNTASKKSSSCDVCGEFEHLWYGEDCVKNFCDYLYNDISPKAKTAKAQVTIIAHNQRGYDGHFIVQDFFKRDFQAVPEMIMTGSKILYSHIENLRFIDSLSLFMQPLSSLVKSFNIKEMKKGHFPHLFNLPQNQNYIGEWPGIHYYQPTQMKPEHHSEFMEWYSSQMNKSFNFKHEIIEYCRSDVNILMTAMIRFINLFKSVTGLNPIVRNFTLASVAMEVFRATMLPKYTLAITPISGYAERKQSISAAAWLDSMQRAKNKEIKREWKLGPFYADGFIPDTKEVFEFWGCYFHGCSSCYSDRNQIVKLGNEELTVSKLLEKVELKKKYYHHLGYQLTEIWEHDFNRYDPYISARISHYETIKQVGFINIRESFFGGRTNNLKFFHKCEVGERIRYLDFTSLYPYVLKKYQYPMSHPKLIQEDFKDVNSYFGFIKCKVIAPSNINIGVLPMRIEKKLMFPLCKSCGINLAQSDCNHTEQERAMTNTWTTIELQEAVRVGYRIIKIYQVLDYKKNIAVASLFSKYVRMWLKIKQEASGWPSWCQTQEDKEKYINDYASAESVNLDPENIEKNPGKRSIAKLMLNSFWGKLAQSHNLPQTRVLRSYADLWALISNEDKELMGIHEASEFTILTQSKFKDDNNENINPGKTNIAVASFVTAYARLELFRLIERIEKHREGRVLYFDTDSVVFIERDGDPIIKCGDYLGELTDEVPDGFTCDTFVTLGPKNYGYEIFNPKSGERKATIKVKGIKLTSAALDLISIQQLVCMANAYTEGNQQSINVKQSNIISDKFNHIVKTRNFEKIYRAVSEKRKIVGNNTRPYGYKS